jgi:hypothetical protein
MKCANPDCSSAKVFSRGLCSGCYSRQRRRGTLVRKNVVNRGACTVDGCDRQAFAKNLCAKHYQQAQHPLRSTWKTLRTRAPGQYPAAWERFEGFLDAVGDRPSDHHQLRRPDPELPWSATNFVWREPIGVPSKTAEERARYAWLWHIRKKYGLSEQDLIVMAEAQGNRCAICRGLLGAPHPDTGHPIKVCIDHDHRTKKVRGLTCDPCNKGLGMFSDDPDRIEAAAAYLRRHKET